MFVPQGSRARETRNSNGKGEANDGDIGDSASRRNDSTAGPAVTTVAPSMAISPTIQGLTADLRTAVLKVQNQGVARARKLALVKPRQDIRDNAATIRFATL